MIITLPKPPSVNHLYGRNKWGGVYIKAEGKTWIEEAGYIIKSQWKRKPLIGDVALYIKYYYCGTWDWDNGNKILSDLLAKMGVYNNDKQVNFAQIETIKVPHRTDEKVEIEIS